MPSTAAMATPPSVRSRGCAGASIINREGRDIGAPLLSRDGSRSWRPAPYVVALEGLDGGLAPWLIAHGNDGSLAPRGGWQLQQQAAPNRDGGAMGQGGGWSGSWAARRSVVWHGCAGGTRAGEQGSTRKRAAGRVGQECDRARIVDGSVRGKMQNRASNKGNEGVTKEGRTRNTILFLSSI